MTATPAPVGDAPPAWHLTVSVVPRTLAGGLLVLVGLVVGRPDVVVLGVPLLVSVLAGVLRRPTGDPAATVSATRADPSRGRVAATLVLEPAPGIATARVRVAAPEHRDGEVLLDARRRREVVVAVTTARTGRQRGFRVDLRQRDASAVVLAEPRTLDGGSVVVLPQAAPLDDLPLPHRLRGLTGAHRSAHPGDGGELRDVAVFAPGDRLRRIDWKATARRAGAAAPTGARGGLTELYVRRTFATSDANVVLVVDARDNVGPDVAAWGSGDVHPADATSLDIARGAAASLARRYLDAGDRVGLTTIGRHRRPLRPAAGRRQLARIVHDLAFAEPQGEPSRHVRAPLITSGALVVVLSTFLDDQAADLAQQWRHAGHRTVAVDVLPPLVTDHLEPRLRTAFRIVRMERADRLATLTASGVEVVPWPQRGPDEAPVAVVLAALARTRRAPR